MPTGLQRYYGKGHLHFITFSCYQRLPLLGTPQARDLVIHELAKIRAEMQQGILKLHLPKAERVKPRKINIAD